MLCTELYSCYKYVFTYIHGQRYELAWVLIWVGWVYKLGKGRMGWVHACIHTYTLLMGWIGTCMGRDMDSLGKLYKLGEGPGEGWVHTYIHCNIVLYYLFIIIIIYLLHVYLID